MNSFEELCMLASKERWCWNLHCTTCGHMHFRFAFYELAMGISPQDPSWKIHKGIHSHLPGSLPNGLTPEQQETLCEICSEANLHVISESCRFPDWLGYLGLVLSKVSFRTIAHKRLSQNWAKQLLSMVDPDSFIAEQLAKIAEGKSRLILDDLERCEHALKRRY